MADSRPFAARVIAGRGGVGKTRLAVEECARLTHAGWVSGFLRSHADSQSLEVLANTSASRLVVVDYAETRSAQVAHLLPMLEASATSISPVRVLLLMRRVHDVAAGSRGQWLDVLRHRGPEMAAITETIDVEDLDKQPIGADDNVALYNAAVEAFSSRLGVNGLGGEHIPSEIASATPLIVLLLAFHIVVDSTAPGGEAAVLDYMLHHEEQYWMGQADHVGLELSAGMMRRVVALATLTAARDRDEASRLLRALAEFTDATNERCAAIVGWAHTLYPGPFYWNPLEPDLIGERLITCELGSDGALATMINESASLRPIAVLSRVNQSEAPAAAEAVGQRMEQIGGSDLLLLLPLMEDLPDPGHLAVRVLEVLDRSGPWAKTVLSEVARLPRVPWDTCVAAIEAIVDCLDWGYPWREKDWRDGATWQREQLGELLLELLRTRTSETLQLLERWLTDTTPFEGLDGTSRSDIACAVLVSQAQFVRPRYEPLARSDPQNFERLIILTARRHPSLIVNLARQWAASGESALRFAAIWAAFGIAQTESPVSKMAYDILLPMTQTDWPGRIQALGTIAGLRPDAPTVREQVLDAVEARELPITSLGTYLRSHPAEVLELFERPLSSADLHSVLRLLRDWFFPDNDLERRALAVIARVENDAEFATDVGMVAEYALYRLHGEKEVSTGRLALGIRLLSTGKADVRSPIYHALAQPPGPPAFEMYRRDAIAAWLSTAPPIADIAILICRCFNQAVEGTWPTEDFVIGLVQALSTEGISDVLLSAISADSTKNAAQFVSRLVETGAVDPDVHLRTFVDQFKAGGDKLAALRAARGF